jgi:hypothetical protein
MVSEQESVDRNQAAASLSKKLTALSYTLTQSELDELGGLLQASGASENPIDAFSGKDVAAGHKPFTLNPSSYRAGVVCW